MGLHKPAPPSSLFPVGHGHGLTGRRKTGAAGKDPSPGTEPRTSGSFQAGFLCAMAPEASAAAGEPLEDLPSNIRDFATDKSHDERRLSDLRQRLVYPHAASDAAAAELGAAKLAREAVEQESQGSQVSIKLLREEISELTSDLEGIKSDGDMESNVANGQAHDMDHMTRQFQQMLSLHQIEETPSGSLFREGQSVMESQNTLKDLVDKMNNITSELNLKVEYEKDMLHCDEATISYLQEDWIMASELDVHERNSKREFRYIDCQGLEEAHHSEVSLSQCHIIEHKTDSSEESCPEVEIDTDSESKFESLPLAPSLRVAQQRLRLAELLSKERQKKPSLFEPNECTLPPLPNLDSLVPYTQNNDSDSACSSTSSDHYEFSDLEDTYATEGAKWESLTAPCIGLASDEEEELLMWDGAVLLGNDPKATEMIIEFDQKEAASRDWQSFLGLPIRVNSGATSRDFLLNLPIVYFGKEEANNCMICTTKFATKDRCLRLPCSHVFHMTCILPWLLKKNQCPGCRSAVSNTDEVESFVARNDTGADDADENAQGSGYPASPRPLPHQTQQGHQGATGQGDDQEGGAAASTEEAWWEDQPDEDGAI